MNKSEKIIKRILSGDMREKYGLDMGVGSIYYNERMLGKSDLEAQYAAFKGRRLI